MKNKKKGVLIAVVVIALIVVAVAAVCINKKAGDSGKLKEGQWIFCFVRATIQVLGEPVFRLALIHFDFA